MAEGKKSLVEDRMDRGRERLQQIAPVRDEAWEFYRGNHYAYLNDKNQLAWKATGIGPRGRPAWLARQSRNLIYDVVLHERSACTQRIPSFQVLPSTSDPEDVTAAHLAQKVALYGYYQWNMRNVASDMVMHALVGGEGFSWVYFDNTIGPYMPDPETGQAIGMGDVRIRVYGSNECYWEPGMRFDASPWHVIEQARSIDSIKGMEGYIGPNKLTADANSRALAHRGRGQSDKPNLVLVSEYLERPSQANPAGRWLCYANGKPIREELPYPGDGEQPCIRMLSYAPDPDGDRDIGLVTQLVDAQRTYEDSNNKAVMMKNLLLQPQFAATPGSMKKQRRTPEPGKVYDAYDPNQNIKVLEMKEIPQSLFELMDRAEKDIGRIAAQNDIPSNVDTASGVEALIERDASRKQAFIADLAEWWSGTMHDCLYEVQQSYTDPRLLQIRGRIGWEPVPDFLGAQLKGEADVRVMPDSIEPRTKASIEQKVMNFAQAFPGAFPPEEIMSAINNGTADALLDSYELNKARANTMIQKIRDGSFLTMGMRPTLSSEEHYEPVYDMNNQLVMDPTTGQPMMKLATEVPAWMPRPFDNVAIIKREMEKWMMTSDWDDLPLPNQDAGNTYYQALLDIEQQQAMRAAEMQQQQAEQLGMTNAAKGPEVSPMPSLPSADGNTQKS